jgi:1,4-dihydroxy-2-naphthoyl-CoA hydrolase
LINTDITIADLNKMSANTMVSNIGIEFLAIGPDFITAKMPVDARTIQPYGLLHGGATVALAETLGSVAAHASIDASKYMAVGLEINANHVKSIRSGYVYGKAYPLHVGKRTHVWEIKIRNEAEELISISRITVSIIEKR